MTPPMTTPSFFSRIAISLSSAYSEGEHVSRQNVSSLTATQATRCTLSARMCCRSPGHTVSSAAICSRMPMTLQLQSSSMLGVPSMRNTSLSLPQSMPTRQTTLTWPLASAARQSSRSARIIGLREPGKATPVAASKAPPSTASRRPMPACRACAAKAAICSGLLMTKSAADQVGTSSSGSYWQPQIVTTLGSYASSPSRRWPK
mmetsp:Transcript_68728/g.188558  ORF Transcript_68728/g.188558 Transcript_68728/m.188558 type:complete len:204 (+) Transcript_68728:1136-1747(+)